MNEQKKTTAPNVSVGTDAGQPSKKDNNNIIPTGCENINNFNINYIQWAREMQQIMNSYYLKTITMSALYETVFETQSPLIDGLLH